jgi:glycosyltransferase involved in cell wall biosynthesis
MHFTIVTPSLNQLADLKRAIASVADQWSPGAGLSLHHHIQDGGSTDGTVAFLKTYELTVRPDAQCPTPSAYTFSYETEKDTGMYDALNKGFNRPRPASSIQHPAPSIKHPASSIQHPAPTILAWLNCDEQYLPGTLNKVADFYRTHPQTELLWGGMLLTDESGELIAFRKSYPARRHYIATSLLYNYSCALFFRANVWDALHGFDTHWKTVADADLILRALNAGFKTAIISDYLATFTFNGQNLSETPLAKQEQTAFKKNAPNRIRVLSPILNIARLIEKLCHGAYRQKFPLPYEIYRQDLTQRKRFTSHHATQRWPH